MTGWRWRLVALLAALAPTVLTLLTQPRAGSYAGFVDRPVDPGLVTEINAWYAWQTVVGLAVPAMVVGLAWLCRRPAAHGGSW